MAYDNPYEPTLPRANGKSLTPIIAIYWNSILAAAALCLHCLVFVTFNIFEDGGRVGRMLFPLAPLALIIAMFCVAVSVVQCMFLVSSFVKHSPVTHHRLCAIVLTWFAVGLIFVAGRFGGFIHV